MHCHYENDQDLLVTCLSSKVPAGMAQPAFNIPTGRRATDAVAVASCQQFGLECLWTHCTIDRLVPADMPDRNPKFGHTSPTRICIVSRVACVIRKGGHAFDAMRGNISQSRYLF